MTTRPCGGAIASCCRNAPYITWSTMPARAMDGWRKSAAVSVAPAPLSPVDSSTGSLGRSRLGSLFWNFRASAPRFRKPDRDCLLPARDLLAGTSAAQRAAFALVHRPFHFLLRRTTVFRSHRQHAPSLPARSTRAGFVPTMRGARAARSRAPRRRGEPGLASTGYFFVGAGGAAAAAAARSSARAPLRMLCSA